MRLQQIRYFTLIFQKILSNVYYYDKVDQRLVRKPVPVDYGSFVRYDRTTQANELNSMRVEARLPIITFSLTAMSYDSSRQPAKSARATSICTVNNVETIPYPIPFMFNLTVYIRSKNRNEVYDILEQIVPYFTPSKTFQIKLKQAHNVIFSDSISLTLNNVSERIDNFDDMESKRKVEWQLDFALNGWLLKTNHIPDSDCIDENGNALTGNIEDKTRLIEKIKLVISSQEWIDNETIEIEDVLEHSDVFLYN